MYVFIKYVFQITREARPETCLRGQRNSTGVSTNGGRRTPKEGGKMREEGGKWDGTDLGKDTEKVQSIKQGKTTFHRNYKGKEAHVLGERTNIQTSED